MLVSVCDKNNNYIILMINWLINLDFTATIPIPSRSAVDAVSKDLIRASSAAQRGGL